MANLLTQRVASRIGATRNRSHTMSILSLSACREMSKYTRSDCAFLSVSALAFVASASATVVCCASMGGMAEMPMPGGWTMSMVWVRMEGETWLEAASSFAGMWVV